MSASARDQLGARAAGLAGDLDQAHRVGRVGGADAPARASQRSARSPSPPPGGWWWRSRCPPCCGPWMAGKRRLQRRHDLGRVVDRERGLGDEGDVAPGPAPGRARRPRPSRPGATDAVRQLAHRAHDLGVAGVADQHDGAAGVVVALGLAMDLGDQRAGGVDEEQARGCAPRPAPPWARRGRRRRRAGRPAPRPAPRRRPRPLASQLVDHVAVVDDLVADIDRRAVPPDARARRSGSRGRRRRRSRAGWRAGW